MDGSTNVDGARGSETTRNFEASWVTPALEVRNRRFETRSDKVPRHWHGGRKAVTSFFDNLSIFFPEGERFFIEAVKAHKEKVRDPRLLKDIAIFCAQEGIHSREHERYNEMLDRQGYPAVELDAKIGRLLTFVRRRLSKRQRLAVTCALEHFTALMADYVLGDPRLLDGADPEMSALWRWHASEESEHRAVAWDVFRETGGTYFERSATMLGAAAIFWALVVQHQWKLMKIDGTHLSATEWKSLFVFLFVDPGGMPQIWRRWLDYFHPRFHPWKRASHDLVQ